MLYVHPLKQSRKAVEFSQRENRQKTKVCLGCRAQRTQKKSVLVEPHNPKSVKCVKQDLSCAMFS